MQTLFPRTDVVAAVLFGILLSGCAERPAARGPHSPNPPGSTAPPGVAEPEPKAATVGQAKGDSQSIRIQPINEKDLANALAQRKGKVVLLDFWATWCLPCVELLPHTVQLRRDLANQGLDVILVSLDDSENEPEVLRVLVSKGVGFENFISRYGTSPKSMEAFAIPDGSLPHLRIYDREGTLRRAFSAGQFQAADIDRVVRDLLHKP